MVVSRRLGRCYVTGYVPAQTIASAAAFHSSRVLHVHAKSSAEAVPPNFESPHDAGDLSGSGSGPRSHRPISEGLYAQTLGTDVQGGSVKVGESIHQVSVVHADATENQATGALNSLLRCSRLSSKPLATEADYDHRQGGDKTPAAAKCIRDTDDGQRAVNGDPLHLESSGAGRCGALDADGESHGEEEILENRLAFADEMEPLGDGDVERRVAATCSAPTTAPLLPRQAAAISHGDRSAAVLHAVEFGATPYGSGEPMNLSGLRYCGDMARILQSVAQSRRFVSLFWSSREAFERVGVVVTAEESAGVLLDLTQSTPVRVFNLEQTSLASEYRAAPFSEVMSRLHVSRGGGGTPCFRSQRLGWRPLDLAGRYFFFSQTDAIAVSPHFSRLQKQSPYWISAFDVEAIGATLRPEEAAFSVEAPIFPFQRSWRDGACASAALSPSGGTQASPTAVLDPRGVASSGSEVIITQYYNVSQLCDRERFNRLNPVRDNLTQCLTINGNLYASSTTWLLWEYCARYYFPLTDTPLIVFLTMEKISRLGGRVVHEKRYPIARQPANQEGNTVTPSTIGSAGSACLSETARPLSVGVPAFEKIDTTHHREMETGSVFGSSESPSTASADAGVVPPPFTMLVHGEVLSMFNALQTDIADIILTRVSRLRESRLRNRFR